MADAPKSFNLSPDIYAYLLDHGSPLDDIQRDLIAMFGLGMPRALRN